MKLGIVGLPNVGKSTIFNALTSAGAAVANYPFCTINPNIGVVEVPDERLYKLASLYNSKKITHTYIEFSDIAGLVKGASKGEGLGNKFLSHIREVDAIVHVVRCFDDPNITHVAGSTDPIRDIEDINLELILSDLEILNRRIEKTRTMMKSGEQKYKDEYAILEKLYSTLSDGKCARLAVIKEEEKDFIDSLFLLTTKKVIYCANIAEDSSEDNDYVKKVKEHAEKEGSEVVVLKAKLEAELADLSPEDKAEFLKELGIETTGLEKLIKKSYKLLGLMSFLTAGPTESRAWTIPIGTKAPQAAGVIHTDFERGFIRAEVVDYNTLMECGSYNVAKEKGKVRSEGKDYIVREGDVILFRFNV